MMRFLRRHPRSARLLVGVTLVIILATALGVVAEQHTSADTYNYSNLISGAVTINAGTGAAAAGNFVTLNGIPVGFNATAFVTYTPSYNASTGQTSIVFGGAPGTVVRVCAGTNCKSYVIPSGGSVTVTVGPGTNLQP